MGTDERLVIAVVFVTLLVVLLVGVTALLLVVNANRRHMHRAQLAEADLRHRQQVMEAEREATQQTLRDMGRELHDNIGQLLSVVQMAQRRVMHTAGPLPDLQDADTVLEQATEEVRRLGRELNTDLWKERDLVEAIRTDAERIERVGRVRVHVRADGPLPTLSPGVNTILFRVYQEVMNNAIKHSGAAHITIEMSATPTLRLSITDNGRGFDPSTTKANAGLHNIRHRCQLVGVEAQCTTAPGLGCRWTLICPAT